jgi:ankyrin repeat protein
MACRADKGEHPAAVAALLELGADPNAKNAKGRTPLTVATSAHFDKTAALLRAAGAH